MLKSGGDTLALADLGKRLFDAGGSFSREGLDSINIRAFNKSNAAGDDADAERVISSASGSGSSVA